MAISSNVLQDSNSLVIDDKNRNSRPSYNLLYEPWIPVLPLPTDDNPIPEVIHVGIKDAILKAHKYLQIISPICIVEYGIYRFLEAFLVDMYSDEKKNSGVKNVFRRIMKDGKFDEESFESYLNVELDDGRKIRDQFDLFDPVCPFYQVSEEHIISVAKDKLKNKQNKANKQGKIENGNGKKKKTNKNLKIDYSAVERIIPFLPSGTESIFHNHYIPDEKNYITAKECAQILLTIPAFTVEGGSGYSSSINKMPPWYIMIRGNNLFETLVFNMPLREITLNKKEETMFADWYRIDGFIDEKGKVNNVSTLEGLTFLTRAIHLFPESLEDIEEKFGKGNINSILSGELDKWMVHKVYYKPGYNFQGEWTDPYVSYRTIKKKTKDKEENIRSPMRPEYEKFLWQDLATLLFKTKPIGAIEYSRAAILDQFDDIFLQGLLVDNKRLISTFFYGMYVDSQKRSKRQSWKREEFRLPGHLIHNAEVGKFIQDQIDYASDVNGLLSFSLRTLASFNDSKKPNKEIFKRLLERANARFWSELEREFLLRVLEQLSDIDFSTLQANQMKAKIEREWIEFIKKFGSEILTWAMDDLDSSGKLMKNQVSARKIYWSKVSEKLPTYIKDEKTGTYTIAKKEKKSKKKSKKRKNR